MKELAKFIVGTTKVILSSPIVVVGRGTQAVASSIITTGVVVHNAGEAAELAGLRMKQAGIETAETAREYLAKSAEEKREVRAAEAAYRKAEAERNRRFRIATLEGNKAFRDMLNQQNQQVQEAEPVIQHA